MKCYIKALKADGKVDSQMMCQGNDMKECIDEYLAILQDDEIVAIIAESESNEKKKVMLDGVMVELDEGTGNHIKVVRRYGSGWMYGSEYVKEISYKEVQ